MNLKYIIGSMVLSTMMSNQVAFAEKTAQNPLEKERTRVIAQYILDLQKGDYKDIATLFDKNGYVVSTSRGHVNAKDFFYGFLPEIKSATTELHHSFASTQDQDRYAARFHFTFLLKDGEKGDGEYIDEFVFNSNTAQLSSVYMFENLKFS